MQFLTLDETQVPLILFFGAGVLLQSILILKKRIFSKDYLFAVIVSCIAFLPGREELVYNPGGHILIYFLCFITFLGVFFRKEIQPLISERSLFQLTIILTYSYLIAVNPSSKIILFLLILTSLPITAFSALTNLKLNKNLKVYSYIWFLITSVTLILFQVNSIDLSYFIQNKVYSVDTDTLVQVFLTGFITFPIVVNIFYVLELLPIPSKNQKWSNKMKEIKENINEMLGKYSDYQVKLKELLLIILIQGGFLLINFFFGFVDKFTAITISLVLVELIVYFRIDYWRILLSLLGLSKASRTTSFGSRF